MQRFPDQLTIKLLYIQSLQVPKLTLITLESEGVGDDERLSLLVVLLFSLRGGLPGDRSGYRVRERESRYSNMYSIYTSCRIQCLQIYILKYPCYLSTPCICRLNNGLKKKSMGKLHHDAICKLFIIQPKNYIISFAS